MGGPRLPLPICGCSAWGVGVEMEAWETLPSSGTAFRGAEHAVARKQAVLRRSGQLRGQGRAEDDGPPDHGQQSPADLGAVASPGPNPGQSGKANG